MSRQNLFVLQEVYGDLVDKFKQIIGMTDFSDQFNNYNTLQTCWPPLKCDAAVCMLSFNPITVYHYASLFICTSICNDGPDVKLFI